MQVKILMLISAFGMWSICGSAQKMDNAQLLEIFQTQCDSIEGEIGAWQFQFDQRAMFCFTDESNNRMRIICPISMVASLDQQTIYDAMIANFHSALDVKYAISEEIMWSIFVHPLKQLSIDQVKDALRQLYSSAETFGTTYNSTDLIFPGGEEDKEHKQNTAPPKKM